MLAKRNVMRTDTRSHLIIPRIVSTLDEAKYLKVSRTTVLLAFENLLLEGYIKGKPGSGTFISNEIPENLLFSNYKGNNSYKLSKEKKSNLNVRGSKLINYLNRERSDYNKFQPFKPGVPDLNIFPYDLWGKLISKAASTIPKSDFGYSSSVGSWILEDDYDSEYRYNGQPLSSLQGIDNNNSVIYMGTFSKVMFPGLRLGYLIVPEDLIEVFTAAKMLIDRNSPICEQSALEKFISEGHYGRHIRKTH